MWGTDAYMGWGHNFKCNNCGKIGDIYYGSGMEYPEDCEAVYEKAQNGEFGDDWKSCVTDNPYGAFDCTLEVYKCTKCNFWKNDSRKNYYISTTAKKLRHRYVTDKDEGQIRCIKRFHHMCPCCSGVMHRVELIKESLNCVECRSTIEIDFYQFVWD